MARRTSNLQIYKLLPCGISFLISLVVLGFACFNPQKSLDLSHSITQNFVVVFNKIYSVKDLYRDYLHSSKTVETLQQEVASLKHQVQVLQGNNSRISVLDKTNKELKKLLDLKSNSKKRFPRIVTANVYYKNLNSNILSFLLDAGKNAGLKNYLPVIFNDALVGKLDNVTDNFSELILLSNSNSRVPIYSQKTKINAIAIGTNKEDLSVLSYDDDLLFIEGEEVLTSGMGKLFPRNIKVGTLHSCDGQWYIKLYNNPNTIYYVHVIIK